jgi:adenosylcobinamide kinase/adenosylcobinamide-phosphate guanylyltransferase
MGLIVLLGGARSGKSALAVSLGARWDGAVVFVATGEARDEEMRDRIDRHRAERPPGWRTLEQPLLGELDVGDEELVILDCLSLWVANALERGDDDEEIAAAAAAIAARAAAHPSPFVAVSNEVGLGLVPTTPLGRRYRDVLGTVNRAFVERSEQALFVVAGRALRLEEVEL